MCPRGLVAQPNTGSPLDENLQGNIVASPCPKAQLQFSFIGRGQTKTLVSIHVHPRAHKQTESFKNAHTVSKVGGRQGMFFKNPETIRASNDAVGKMLPAKKKTHILAQGTVARS